MNTFTGPLPHLAIIQTSSGARLADVSTDEAKLRLLQLRSQTKPRPVCRFESKTLKRRARALAWQCNKTKTAPDDTNHVKDA